ncbi:MAG TPA: hypothetical protein PLY93_03300 [Turneriella sp.]|nr:hypothetical protein [Turneriella sp.]
MISIKRTLFLFCTFSIILALSAQSKVNDIPVEDLSIQVKGVLESYASILHRSASLEEAAEAFTPIAGGTLVNDDNTLSRNTIQFGLKKDFNNFKHYAYPIRITRVNRTLETSSGYGQTKVSGTGYKIWIAKKDPSKGMPAPVTIILPATGTAKVVNVGSY